MSGLLWHAPAWLLLAFIPWLLHAWEKRRGRSDRLARYAEPHLLSQVLLPSHQRSADWLAPVAWTLAAVAAAGPTWQGGDDGAPLPGADIAFVVDISPSMAVADVLPDRLTRVKESLREFVAQAHADRYALVVFSANAYIALPLTQDKNAFLHFLDALDTRLVNVPGSNLGRALMLAGEAMRGARHDGGAAIVISDGGWHDRDVAFDARQLRERGIAVHALGVGTTRGAPVPDGGGGYVRDAGKLVTAPLDAAALRAVAAAGGGRYFALPGDAREWRSVRAVLQQHLREKDVATPGLPLWPWPLAAAVALFLLAGTLRPASFAAWLIGALALPLLHSTPAYAADPERVAYAALQRGDYDQAARSYARVGGYAGVMGRAAVAYRRGLWGEAALLYRQAERHAHTPRDKARATYNLGTTLTRLRRYDEAKVALRRALALQPNYPRASLNLTLLDSLAPRMGTAADQGTGASASRARQQAPEKREAQRSGGEQTPDGASRESAAENAEQRMPPSSEPPRSGGADAGVATSPAALGDDTRALLMRRFAIEDTQPGVLITRSKPW